MVVNNVSASDPISIRPVPITAGEQITIRYNGFLSNNQPQEIYAHAGYGPNDRWENIQDIRLQRTANGWEGKTSITQTGRFNICFRDNNFRWDNNYGHNWSYEIHNGDTSRFSR